jgi:hypothetical protein
LKLALSANFNLSPKILRRALIWRAPSPLRQY